MTEDFDRYNIYLPSLPFLVFFLVPPTIEPIDEEQVAYVEETVRLFCQHDGFPIPTVMWMRGEDKVNVHNRNKYVVGPDSSLTIYRLQDQDSGEYTCNVGNEAGIASVTTELTVLSEYIDEDQMRE